MAERLDIKYELDKARAESRRQAFEEAAQIADAEAAVAGLAEGQLFGARAAREQAEVIAAHIRRRQLAQVPKENNDDKG